MATYVNNSALSTAAAANTTLTKPTSLAAGHYMVAQIHVEDDVEVTPPIATGAWHFIGSTDHPSQALDVWWFGKRANAADVAATNFTFVHSSTWRGGTLTAFSSATEYVNAIHAAATGTSSTAASPALTAQAANSGLVFGIDCFQGIGGFVTPPTGMDERYDPAAELYMATQTVAASGSTGTRSTSLGASKDWIASLVLIEDAAYTVTHPHVYGTETELGTSLGSANAMPVGSDWASGDLIIAIVANDNTGATNLSASTGWTAATIQGTTGMESQVFARVLDGTTGNNILSITGAAEDYVCHLLRVKSGRHPVTSGNIATWVSTYIAATTGASGNADPPNLAPGSSSDYLWIVAGAVDMGNAGDLITADPSSYRNLANAKSAGSTSSVGLRVAMRQATASSENPGAFANTSRAWHAWTIAVPTSIGAGGQTWTGSAAVVDVAGTSGAFTGGTATWSGSAGSVDVAGTSGSFTAGLQTWSGGSAGAVSVAGTSGVFAAGTGTWVGGTAAVSVAGTSGTFTGGTSSWAGSVGATDVMGTSGVFVAGTAVWAGTSGAVSVAGTSGMMVAGGSWAGSVGVVDVAGTSGVFTPAPWFIAASGKTAPTGNNPTAMTVAWPAGVAAGDLVLVDLILWNAGATANLLSGWTTAASIDGGTGTSIDTHATVARTDYHVGVGGESLNQTWTLTATNGDAGQMFDYRGPYGATGLWDIAASTGDDATHGADRSVTTSGTLELKPGDLVAAGVAVDTDAALTITAPTFTAAGIVFGTVNRRTSGAGATGGNDGNVEHFDTIVVSGSATVAVSFAFTTATSQCGPVTIVRARQLNLQTWTGSTGAVSVAGASGTFTGGTSSWAGSTAAVSVAGTSGTFASGGLTWTGSPGAVAVAGASGAFTPGAVAWAGSSGTVHTAGTSGAFVAGTRVWSGSSGAVAVSGTSGSFSFPAGPPQTWTGNAAAVRVQGASGSFTLGATPWTGTAGAVAVSGTSGVFTGGGATWTGTTATVAVQGTTGTFAAGAAAWTGNAGAVAVIGTSGVFTVPSAAVPGAAFEWNGEVWIDHTFVVDGVPALAVKTWDGAAWVP